MTMSRTVSVTHVVTVAVLPCQSVADSARGQQVVDWVLGGGDYRRNIESIER